MKSTASLVTPLLLLILSGCGGKTPDAQTPENADQSGSSSSKDGKTDGSDKPALGATGKDEGKKAPPSKCKGFEISDLLAVLNLTECELPEGTADPQEREVKDLLEIKVSPEQHATPGSPAKVRILYKNKSKKDLALDFVVDPEPRFTIEVLNAKGKHADNPPGEEPSLPTSVSDAPVPERRYARVTLTPNGSAGLTLTWNTVKYKWASQERAKGSLPGRGFPRDPAGPLPKGKYFLKIVTPLVGVTEESEHEITQPRVEVQLGGA
jgi:hypothetical protein